jgi:hypothetical protein
MSNKRQYSTSNLAKNDYFYTFSTNHGIVLHYADLDAHKNVIDCEFKQEFGMFALCDSSFCVTQITITI